MECYIKNGSEDNEIISKKLFRQLKICIKNKENVVIMGVRGSGKTELLNAFFSMDYKMDMARNQKKLIYQVNLSDKETKKDIFVHLTALLVKELDVLLMDKDQKEDSGNSELDRVKMQLLDHSKVKDDEDAEAEFKIAVDVLHAYGYFIIFVMDSFERFTSSTEITMEHHEVLRSLVVEGKVQCIVATDYDLTVDSLPKNMPGSYLLSTFMNQSTVAPFSEEEAIKFVKIKQQDYDAELSEQQIKQLHRLSGGIWKIFKKTSECALEQLEETNGVLDVKQLVADTSKYCYPLFESWCKYLTTKQADVLQRIKDQINETNRNRLVSVDFTGDQLFLSTVDQLMARGVLRTAVYQDANGMILKGQDHDVCMNSLLFQRFCMERDLKEFVRKNPLMKEQPAAAKDEPVNVPIPGNITINIGTLNGDLQNRMPGSTDHIMSVNGENVQVVQNNIAQGVTAKEILGLLSTSSESGQSFAALLSKTFMDRIDNHPLICKTHEEGISEEEAADHYDSEFHRESQSYVQDVEVDADGKIIDVSLEQLQLLDHHFADARNHCRKNLTDEILVQQSERCQFYLKLSVVVEHALDLPGFLMEDYSPQLVLYGKALEQALRDNLYELFHREEELSVYDTYKHRSNPASEKIFGKLNVDKAYIANYAYVIAGKKGHLEDLCETYGIESSIYKPFSSWNSWWNLLQKDIHRAREIRNLADHADPVSPCREDLNQMCSLLFGDDKNSGILNRVVVGRQLSDQLF